MKCDLCKIWADTGRPCTIFSHGECDCPKCFGICGCDPLCGSEEDDYNTYRRRLEEKLDEDRAARGRVKK